MTVTSKNRDDLLKSFELLKTLLKSFEEGNNIVYLSMAVELRKLLCEKNPSPLITRVIPNFKLHKLHFVKIIENTPSLLEGLVNFMPGSLHNSQNKVTTFTLLFSKDKELMGINDWTNQIFFKESITIRELIESVANKEAAHSDKNYNETLIHCRNWSFNDIDCHILGIYGIAQYIYSVFVAEYRSSLK